MKQGRHSPNSACPTASAITNEMNSKKLFEFVDIFVSRNTILLKHIDFKNDHRKGYNICVVYSFHQIFDELICQVSVIVITRSSVGVELDSIYRYT